MPKHSTDGLHEPLVAAGIGLSRPASPGSEGKELRSLASDGLSLAAMAMAPEPEPEVLTTSFDGSVRFESGLLSPPTYRDAPGTGTAILMQDQDDDDDDGLEFAQQKDGWNPWVFFPQLVLRLFPPLMLLQLFPDFRPRVDVIMLCVGSAFAVMSASQDFPLGVAVLLVMIGVCQLLDTATEWQQNSKKCFKNAWIVVPLTMSVFILLGDAFWWDGSLSSNGQDWKTPLELLTDALPSAVLFTVGVISVAVTVVVRLRWLYAWSVVTDQFCVRDDEAEKKWTWSRPATYLFTERFEVGEIMVCGDKLKARQRLLENARSSNVRHPSQDSNWKKEMSIDTATLFTSQPRGRQKRHRLRETCSGLSNRTGLLRPKLIMKRHQVEGVWTTPQWVDPAKLGLECPNALDVSVSYVEKGTAPAQLVLKLATPSDPDEPSHFDAAFAAGYRVRTARHVDSESDRSSLKAYGDYMLPIKGKKLRFRKRGKNCEDMFLDYGDSEGWTIGPDKGPGIFSGRSEPRQSPSRRTRRAIDAGLVKTAQPPRKGWSREYGAQTAEDVQVDAFYIVKYEVVFPRRVNFNLKEILGASVQSSKTNVEFWMLQIEAFFFLFLQLLAQMILLHLYFKNKDKISHDDTYEFGLFSSLMGWVSDAWVEAVLTEDGMYLPDSEILLPAVMYVFVAMISASEHACFSGLDSVADSREKRWYRRGLHYWKMTTEDEQDTDSQPGSQLLGVIQMRDKQMRKSCTCMDILRCNCNCDVVPAVYYYVLIFALKIARLLRLLPNDGPSKAFRSESNIKWFSRQVSLADKKVSTSMRYDQRDNQRRHELLHTYIESPMYDDDLELDGYQNFIADVRTDVEDEFIDVGGAMKVYDMDASPREAEAVAVSPYEEDFRRENTRTYMKASSIADMIMHLSRSRRLVHAKGEWLVNIAAVFHGTMPLWHALLPCKVGGGCLCNADTEDTFDHDANGAWFIACSENGWQAALHLSCAVLSAWLARGVLLRLLKCQKDYMWRYVNMLYFVQRTPWTSMRAEKTHWGLLPKFDLDTRGNVDAWNKIRLYLQAYRIKTSRYRQVSVLLCFVAVVVMAAFKGFMVIASRSGLVLAMPSVDCEHYDKTVCLHHTEEEGDDCEWQSTDGSSNRSRNEDGFCQSRDLPACRSFVNMTLCGHIDYCTWVNGWQEGDTNGRCAPAAQNFDTFAMFAFFDTAVVGFWLSYVLYWGVLENEIKTVGFPYVLRMKISELESAALHFVTERAQWTSKTKVAEYWRPEDKGLHTISKKSKDLGTDAAKNARMEYDQQGNHRLNLKIGIMKHNFNDIETKGHVLYHQLRSSTSTAAAALALSEHDVYICGATEPDNGVSLDGLRKLFKQYSLIAKTSSSRLDASSRRIAIQNSGVFLLFLSKGSARGSRRRSATTTCTLASFEVQTELKEAFRLKKRVMLMQDSKDRFSEEDLQRERRVQIHIDPDNPPQKLLTEHQIEWVLNLKPVILQRKSHNYVTCLDRPYVQKEVRWAKQYKKPIITIYEKDPARNGFFDYQKARKKYADDRVRCNCTDCDRGESGTDHQPGCPREWESVLGIDAIAFERGTYLVDAMLRNIYAKVSEFEQLYGASMNVHPLENAKNKPGKWDFFLSHQQATGGDQVQNLYHHFDKEKDDLPRKTAWLDNQMMDRSELAMEEGVRQCSCFILFLSADSAEKQADAMMKKVSNGIKGHVTAGEDDLDQDNSSDDESEAGSSRPDVLVYTADSDQQRVSSSLTRAKSNLRRPDNDNTEEFLSEHTEEPDDQARSIGVDCTSRPGAAGAVDLETERQMREDLISLLRGLADTLDREHSNSLVGSHWGVEDRTTKMWFIALTRHRLYLIIAVTVAQILMASAKAYMSLSGQA